MIACGIISLSLERHFGATTAPATTAIVLLGSPLHAALKAAAICGGILRMEVHGYGVPW